MGIKLKYKKDPEIQAFPFGLGTVWPSFGAVTKEHLGGKGYSLRDMADLGVPVPPGFTFSPSLCQKILAQPARIGDVQAEITMGVERLSKFFGYTPLFSVRSGARVSLPGMCDTILNVGLTTSTLPEWVERLGERGALDSYRRLIQMYANVAMKVPSQTFEKVLESVKERAHITLDTELSVEHLKRLIEKYHLQLQALGLEFPDSLWEQLVGASMAVFRSWNNPRAIEYRQIHGIPEEWGTGVTIQSMVFGNLNDQSATGVLFTRDPASGEDEVVGEFLVNAQGEDVVAGIRTPRPLAEMADWNKPVLDELLDRVITLEQHYKDMQDVEFTVQDGKLFILQARNGKRSAKAAFKIAHDMADQGLIQRVEAVGRISAAQLASIMQDAIDPSFTEPAAVTGIAAGGSVVTGVAVFSSADAINCTEPCILIRRETSPEDIGGMNAAVGILTSTGGMTSHAAVVARGMGKTCVVGATDLWVDEGASACTQNGKGVSIHKGTKVTLDGATGRVWVNTTVPVIQGGEMLEARKILGWAMEANPAVYERITLAGPVDQFLHTLVMSECSRIWVDTAFIQQDKYSFGALGTALAACQATAIVVDLSHLADALGAADRVLEGIFNRASTLNGGHLDAMSNWPQQVKDRVRVKVSGTAQPKTIATLKTYGFKLISPVQTVADLLDASGPVEVSNEVVNTVFGSQAAYLRVVAMIEASTGKSLSGCLGRPVYWHSFLSTGGAL